MATFSWNCRIGMYGTITEDMRSYRQHILRFQCAVFENRKKKPFITVYCELTWPIGWERCCRWSHVMVAQDFSPLQALDVGWVAGSA